MRREAWRENEIFRGRHGMAGTMLQNVLAQEIRMTGAHHGDRPRKHWRDTAFKDSIGVDHNIVEELRAAENLKFGGYINPKEYFKPVPKRKKKPKKKKQRNQPVPQLKLWVSAWDYARRFGACMRQVPNGCFQLLREDGSDYATSKLNTHESAIDMMIEHGFYARVPVPVFDPPPFPIEHWPKFRFHRVTSEVIQP